MGDGYESDAYDAGSPKAPGYVDRLIEKADDRRTFAGTDLGAHDAIHDLGKTHAALEAERPAPRELKAWDL